MPVPCWSTSAGAEDSSTLSHILTQELAAFLGRCLMPETALDPETRFWKRVTKTEGCWIWTGRLTREGYGQICTGAGRRPMAHRFSYELHLGPIPEGLE